jgi:adenylate cyclase
MIGVAHFIAQRYDDAIAALGRSPDMPLWVQAYLAACCALAAMPERARDYAAEVLRRSPNFSASRFATKGLFKRTADTELLITGLRKAGIPE